jgi:hypothetical protein
MDSKTRIIEILGEYVHKAAFNGAAARYYAVPVGVTVFHSEVGAAVLHEHIVFFEATLVQEEGQALAGREFSFGVLGLDAFLSAAQAGFGPAFHQFLNIVRLDAHICVCLFLQI